MTRTLLSFLVLSLCSCQPPATSEQPPAEAPIRVEPSPPPAPLEHAGALASPVAAPAAAPVAEDPVPPCHEPAAEGVPGALDGPQIPDVTLLDQTGKEVNLVSEVMAGKLVFLNSIFTSCQATCPVQTRAFARLQDSLGDRMDREVRLISISVDPLRDTPERLAEYARRHGAKPGWYFLTGDRATVLEALKAMDMYAARPEEHTPMAAVGNAATGVWRKVLNLKPPAALLAELEVVAGGAP